MKLENLTNNVLWNITNKTEEEIKGYVNNYCKDMNVYYSNLVITNTTTTFTTYSKISYEDLVVKLIREKYSLNDELSIHRKSMFNTDNEEFTNYYAYVEDCKSRARQWIEERDNLINK